MKRKSIRERAIEAFDMPKDLMLNLPKINIVGDKEAYIENYKSVLAYNEDAVKLKMQHKNIEIKGRRLQIRTITDEDILISGEITSIEFN